ncbi:MAG: NAD(+)/NADH kinase [Rikenellaceae bacterium]|nr:NAD(+)/NADH kinase [Rikenellaceae bacterium]
MKIVFYSRPDLSYKTSEVRKLYDAIITSGFEYFFSSGFARIVQEAFGVDVPKGLIFNDHGDFPEGADMLICYGGDGTFLDGVRILDSHRVPILGINSGRLGFLADIPEAYENKIFEDIINGLFDTEERMLLEVSGEFDEGVDYPYAFNEFSVQKSGMEMISVEVFINGEFITTYVGDGVILSTPSGSTAYSLSVGGPIIAPNSKCFVISPIAPHNLTMRPVVIPDDSTMEFRVLSRSGKAVVTMDNRDYEVKNGSSFTLNKAQKTVFLVKFENNSFYRTLREKMIWGVDTRKFTK